MKRTSNAHCRTSNAQFFRSSLRRPCRRRLVDCADNCARNRELDQVPDNPAAQDFSSQRLYRVEDEIITNIDEHHQEGEASRGACATCGNKSCAKQREEECHYDVPKNQRREVIAKIGFGFARVLALPDGRLASASRTKGSQRGT